MSVIEIKAPEIRETQGFSDPVKVFFAGSIEMGAAEMWQDRALRQLADAVGNDADVIVFNPRRDDWDSSWIQDPSEGTKFNEQVTWELNHLIDADYVFFYFDPNTKSPISLLELGFLIGQFHHNIIVVCPPEFYRYGNVKLICDFAKTDPDDQVVFHTLDQGLDRLTDIITEYLVD